MAATFARVRALWMCSLAAGLSFQAPPKPAYMLSSWWEPPEPVASVQASAADGIGSTDECFWDSGCGVDEDAFSVLRPERNVPCVTTDEGCAFFSQSWWHSDVVDAQPPPSQSDGELLMATGAVDLLNECYWDEGCIVAP